MPPQPIYALDRKRFAPLLADLYLQSEGAKVGVTQESFATILCAVAAKYLAANSNEKDARSFLSGLRVAELTLARACSAGNETAWELFLTRFREPLYNAGR